MFGVVYIIFISINKRPFSLQVTHITYCYISLCGFWHQVKSPTSCERKETLCFCHSSNLNCRVLKSHLEQQQHSVGESSHGPRSGVDCLEWNWCHISFPDMMANFALPRLINNKEELRDRISSRLLFNDPHYAVSRPWTVCDVNQGNYHGVLIQDIKLERLQRVLSWVAFMAGDATGNFVLRLVSLKKNCRWVLGVGHIFLWKLDPLSFYLTMNRSFNVWLGWIT